MYDNRLVILSDLWGINNAAWISHYIELLSSKFDVKLYDCKKLGEIGSNVDCVSIIHSQFISGGIEKAVKKLLEKEKNKIYVLGFSIGGLIAWRAALAGLQVKYMCLLSSTRLRYERQVPSSLIELYYAESDNFRPDCNWLQSHGIKQSIIKSENHEFYRKSKFAKIICNNICARQI